MTRYREIMRLSAMGQPPADVAAAAGCSDSTVRRALKAAEAAGLEWPLPEEMGDDAIRKLIYPKKFGKHGDFPDPDYERVHEQLKRKGVTRALLYEEYCDACRASGSRPCSTTTFNNGYAEWAASQCLTMHIDRKPGQKMEVDWAGTGMSLVDRDAGELVDVHVFVACLPFSGKLYAEGFLGMDSECWLTAHVHAFDFYGGVADELVPDNCKTAVIKRAKGKDPVLNRSYSDLAEHYGCAISPARVRRPRDKANVEAGVGIVTRRAIAALRDRRFFTLGELNAALSEKVAEINSAQFTRKPGSRASVFEAQERAELAPLPESPFQVCSWERATVRPDYHVAARGRFYSVPFEYAGKVVDVRITQQAVEAFFHDARIASHPRGYDEGGWSTRKSHMPESHAGYLEWNAEGLAKRAAGVGPSCERAAAAVMGSQETRKRSIGRGKALLALAGRYGAPVLESACARALAAGGGLAVTVEQVECMCAAEYKSRGDVEDSGAHAILRGKGYYEGKGE